MKFSTIIIILSLLFLSKAEAQINKGSQTKGFRLEISVPTQKNSKIYLGQYWNNLTYSIDSTQTSNEGKAIFSIDKELPEGQYFIYVKPAFQIDILVGKGQDNIKLSLNESDLAKNTVSGSTDTKLLWEYLHFMEQNRKKKTGYEALLKDSTITEAKRSDITKNIEAQDKEKYDYTNSFVKKHGKEWAGVFIKGLMPVSSPHPSAKDSKEFQANKAYLKDHFFDNIDLTDPRLWRTNFLTTYIDNYMQRWVEPIPDSLASAASKLVAKAKGNDFCFKQMLSRFTNESIKSLRMGDENIWAQLYEEYIKDKNLQWIDSTQTQELYRMYEAIRYNRIGMTAHNLRLRTIDGDTINISEIQAELLVLYFYDPECSHCKEEMPKLRNEIYPKYKQTGLEIIAFAITSDTNVWRRFVEDNKLSDWINCIDPDFKSGYWKYYDTTGIPMVYVLNKDKKIIAKKIDLKNLSKILDYHLLNTNGVNKRS